MQIKETIDVCFPGSVESPPPEDAVVLVGTAGVALGVQRAFSPVQRFAEGRGGAVGMESEQRAGTLVRLFLPRVHAATVPISLAGTEIAYTPSRNGGVFHVVNPAAAAPTS